ncbi:hypothetical protein JXM67_10310 [candidate division WOR-3 bacterium]|nr:hypothetical protein [candidate division WOR-3 bacterium]
MKTKGLLIALIISLGINLGTVATLSYYTIKKANPKNYWKNWQSKYDETWEELEDSLELDPELVSDIRTRLRDQGKETMPLGKNHKPYRDSLIEFLKQSEFDTARLNYLLTREAEIESEISFVTYKNLFETKNMLPEEAQEGFIDFFDVSIRFTGKPWYITTREKKAFKVPED